MAELGDHGWEVEWCPYAGANKKIADTEDGDLYMLRYEYQHFRTKGLAVAYARKMARVSVYGTVAVRPATFVDPWGSGLSSTYRWEADADADATYYSVDSVTNEVQAC